jgi:hypothetical protein
VLLLLLLPAHLQPLLLLLLQLMAPAHLKCPLLLPAHLHCLPQQQEQQQLTAATCAQQR